MGKLREFFDDIDCEDIVSYFIRGFTVVAALAIVAIIGFVVWKIWNFALIVIGGIVICIIIGYFLAKRGWFDWVDS